MGLLASSTQVPSQVEHPENIDIAVAREILDSAELGDEIWAATTTIPTAKRDRRVRRAARGRSSSTTASRCSPHLDGSHTPKSMPTATSPMSSCSAVAGGLRTGADAPGHRSGPPAS